MKTSNPPWHNNVPCVVWVETTGPNPSVNSIIEITLMPLKLNLELKDSFLDLMLKPADTDFKPDRVNGYVAKAAIENGIWPDVAVDRIEDWFNGLSLKENTKLGIISFDYHLKHQFLYNLLGKSLMERMFLPEIRDLNSYMNCLNDQADWKSEVCPFRDATMKRLDAYFNDVETKIYSGLDVCNLLRKSYKIMLTSPHPIGLAARV